MKSPYALWRSWLITILEKCQEMFHIHILQQSSILWKNKESLGNKKSDRKLMSIFKMHKGSRPGLKFLQEICKKLTLMILSKLVVLSRWWFVDNFVPNFYWFFLHGINLLLFKELLCQWQKLFTFLKETDLVSASLYIKYSCK